MSLTKQWPVASGKWNNQATWKDGAIPGDGARALINKAHNINLTHQPAGHLMTLRVDGTLNFARRKNTRLIVDTLVSTKDSLIKMGTESRPILANKKASIVIKDWNQGFETTDTLSPDYDPSKVGQGVIIHGRFVAVGAKKTPYATFSGANAGDTYLHLEEFPVNWRSGDTIVIAGTSKKGVEAEERTITSVDPVTKSISLNQALSYDHQTPEHTIEGLELKIHVANLSLNVSIETDESGRVATNKVQTGRKSYGDAFNARGHVMFMHTNDIVAKYAGFYHLGRTNKLIRIEDSKFSDAGDTLLVGQNPRARYSLHFHRAGSDSVPGIIDSCAVISSPGWGYVNHSSNVEMTSNVAYKVTGASFVTEAGDENGTFVSNLAIETRGRGRTLIKEWLTRNSIGDWGFLGHAFWFNGVYVDIINNIANGSSNYAYGFARASIDNVKTVNTLRGEKDYARVTLKTFAGNQAYGNSGGVLASWGGNEGNTLLFSDTLGFSNFRGGNGAWFNWWYSESIKFDGVTLINDI
ncbi:MAG: hypothetical protein KZQ57_13225, partial [gamma proteobacterium symbiont of Lucinoma myriamae]|nr:hypothetical protein [gamma proteobacterium symbiont of Lucinoma myriamae]